MMLNQFAVELITSEFRKKFKTCWDLVQHLSDEEYLKLRKNPSFISILESQSLIDITDEEIVQLMVQPSDSQSLYANKKCDEKDDESFCTLENKNEIEQFVTEDVDIILDEPKKTIQKSGEVVSSYQDNEGGHDIFDFQLAEKVSIELNNMRLNLTMLNKGQHYAIERIQQRIPEFGLKELLSHNINTLSQYPGIGAKVINSLLELLMAVRQDLIEIDAGYLDYQKYEANYIIPISLDVITVEMLQTFMSEDIATFIEQLTEQEKIIFDNRVGYAGNDIRTLQEVGDILQVTRERIRQIEAEIYHKLKRSLRVNEFQLREILTKNLSYKLPKKMASMFFKTDKLFFNFLEKMSNLENLNKIANPDELDLKLDILDGFFVLNGIESSYHEIFTYLYTHDDINMYCSKLGDLAAKEAVIESYIEKLVRLGRLQFVSEFSIKPQLLSKDCAAATLLCNYPEGLHWSDIGRKVNELNLSRTRLEEIRPDHGALGMKYTYLLDKGVYGNTKFLNLDYIDFDKCFDSLLEIFVQRDTETLHLTTVFETFDKRIVSNYYTLRHIIRNFGEDYGFYFNGKSQVDNVSLNKDAKTIGQEDLIVMEMNNHKKPMNKEEIAQLLKSKSVNHASFYLDKLIDEGLVVRIDHMLYTTPQLAYESIDLELILKSMNILIMSSEKPIDYSYFEYFLNAELDLNYSMYLYGSIARKYAEENSWFRKQFLFSRQEIPYSNVSDAITQVCQPTSDIQQRLKDLKAHIYIEDERAKNSIYQNSYRETIN